MAHGDLFARQQWDSSIIRQEPENEEVEYIGDMAGDMEEDEVKEPPDEVTVMEVEDMI